MKVGLGKTLIFYEFVPFYCPIHVQQSLSVLELQELRLNTERKRGKCQYRINPKLFILNVVSNSSFAITVHSFLVNICLPMLKAGTVSYVLS